MPGPASIPRLPPGGLITCILPSAAVAAESSGPLPEVGRALFLAEERAVRTAGSRRRAEFTAGRLCARMALARLGIPAAPILPGPAGEPCWPAGVVGSITHCPGYRACAVARAADLAAIGIDAEPDQDLPGDLTEVVATPAELAWIRRREGADPTVRWARLVFTAKEAAGKAWYPLTGRWPEHGELAVSAAADGTLTVRLPGAGPGRPAAMTGRWLALGGLIITAVSAPCSVLGIVEGSEVVPQHRLA
jgi:4'-phosphopantetheinyl transferase EntD